MYAGSNAWYGDAFGGVWKYERGPLARQWVGRCVRRCGGGAKNKIGARRRRSVANGLRIYAYIIHYMHDPAGLPPDKYTCIINDNIYI